MSKKVSGWPLIVPKEVDTSITGDQVMEALAADVEASDSGKVLTATYSGLEGEETGSVMWASPLPIIGEGDAGKVLTVNAGETGAEWAAASGGLQVYQAATILSFTGSTVMQVTAALNTDIDAVFQQIKGKKLRLLQVLPSNIPGSTDPTVTCTIAYTGNTSERPQTYGSLENDIVPEDNLRILLCISTTANSITYRGFRFRFYVED